MQIVLRVPADKLLVFGEGDITLQDARSHPGSRFVRLASVLGKLQLWRRLSR